MGNQTGTIQVDVSNSGKDLVKVDIDNGKEGTATLHDGLYFFNKVPIGKHTLTFYIGVPLGKNGVTMWYKAMVHTAYVQPDTVYVVPFFTTELQQNMLEVKAFALYPLYKECMDKNNEHACNMLWATWNTPP